jgi:alanine-glyoxylate transaminase/(R)-3-amino-2-methylpropionate-pyruvate transaminase
MMLPSKNLLKYFSSLSLPPTNYKPQSFTGNPEEVLSKRQKHIPLTYPTYYKTPLIITEGNLQYLFDHKGNRYLDL